MSRYKFMNNIYDEDIENYGINVGGIDDLLFDLEEQGEIESSTTTVYNIKNCDGYYEDERLEDFIQSLIGNGIIEVVD